MALRREEHDIGVRITRRAFLALAAAPVLARALGGVRPGGILDAALGGGGGLRRIARPADVDLGPLGHRTLWTYDGRFPGPEIRVREGERIRVVVQNELTDPTTVHWHGLPVPNPMDGVPGLTQEPIAPGASFVYAFEARPAGTYLYHSHQGLQIQRGLVGPLIVEEQQPHVAYDRDYTLVLGDLLPGDVPDLGAVGGGRSRRGMMGGMGRGRMMGGGMGAMNALGIPEYAAVLINGRPAEDPAVFQVRSGDRVRLRFLNPSGATTYRIAIAGHRMIVTHADGRPVKPVEVDAFEIGMGERYDVIVEATRPGVWPIAAAPLQGTPAPAVAALRYDGVQSRSQEAWPRPGGLDAGRLLRLADLEALDPPDPGDADRELDVVLSGGMMMSSAWTMGGQAYPDADPIEIRRGERVRIRMRNMSMALHPMHLHGHFFRVQGAWKDTVIVPPHMGQVELTFRADNPGRWLFHCHNAYHMEMGMAREVRYVA